MRMFSANVCTFFFFNRGLKSLRSSLLAFAGQQSTQRSKGMFVFSEDAIACLIDRRHDLATFFFRLRGYASIAVQGVCTRKCKARAATRTRALAGS